MSAPVDVLAVFDKILRAAHCIDVQPPPDDEVVAARAAIAELIADHRAMYRAYVRMLESARDLIIDFGGSCDPVDVMELGDPALIRWRQTFARLGGAA